MTNILEAIDAKPSKALRAMLKGLEEAAAMSGFVIDMNTFGRVSGDGICHACAATCTLQRLVGRRLTPDEVDSLEWLVEETRDEPIEGFEIGEIHDFLRAMDDIRRGDLTGLMEFCGVGHTQRFQNCDFKLSSTAPIQGEIPKVEALILELEQNGM